MQARKRFGQNFLHDQNQIQRIVSAIDPKPNQQLLEIGPGHGAITNLILQKSTNLTVVEIDRDLVSKLKLLHPSLDVIEADILKFDFASLPGENLRVIGNLPYNITTPLLFRLFDCMERITDMHFMLQLEVVDRLTARANSKHYGRLSIMSQYYCQSEKLFEVPPECFSPKPNVMSAIVRLIPKSSRNLANDEKLFSEIVNHAFSMRRKTIRNGLKKFLTEEQIRAVDIDPGLRPENIDLAGFIRLSNEAGKVAQ